MKRRFSTKTLLVSALFAVAAAPLGFATSSLFAQDDPHSAPAPTKLLRYPDIFENQVAFCYGGDIWKSDLDGQNVVRLTAHAGQEVFPKFSPDGKWIAFTGQYDGDDQVYVIPSQGGQPKQLTYYPTPFAAAPRRGVEAQVLGWTPDGKVVFRAKRDSNGVDSLTNIYVVSVHGGLPEKIGTPVAGAGDLSLDGRKLVYSPLYRDFRHWKRYEGGWAQYLLIFDRETKEFSEIPTTPRTDRDPVWCGDRVYFVSDRDGTMNLYKFVPEDGEKPVQKVTESQDWDVRWASSDGKNQIVYELAGTLRVLNVENGETRELSITVPHDGLAMRPRRVDASKNLESFGLSPKGERALFVARGEIFTVPQENGLVRNLTKTSGAHDRCPVWSPNGEWLAFVSDESGEDQIYLVDQLGKNGKIQLTESLRSKIDDLNWSPDGSALSFRDAYNRLWALTLKTNDETKTPERDKLVEVARDKFANFPGAAWSPDGAYLAYELGEPTDYTAIYVWEKATGESRRVTDPNFNNYSPAWSADGNWLFYIGQREFYPQFSSIEWNFAGDRFEGIFATALRKDVPNLFEPKSDEAATDADEKADEAEAKDGEKTDADATAEKAEPKKIDFDGIESRVVRLPIESDNYGYLSVANDVLFFVRQPAQYYGRGSDTKPELKTFNLKDQKLETFLDDCGGYSISADGTKILVHRGGFKMYDVASKAGEAKSFSTDGLEMDLVPTEEWNEVFEEVWRRFRDYFYVENMHGVDWNAVGDQYRSLLPHVSHRCDLTYILTEMISELNIGHAYVEGGDYVVPSRPKCALPGATFELDAEKNLYKIAKIYRGQNEEPKYRSPLTEVGVVAAEGDYVLAIDGEKLVGTDNPYRLLQHKEGQVTLTLSKDGGEENAWTTVYKPVDAEDSLRYLDFVLDRQERVAKASDGRLGYIHVPDMGGNGAYEFIKWYYPQRFKDGIVVDVRNNGGGNISPWIIMRLNQKLLGTRYGKVRETPTTYPTIACDARLVCLINETSASDGDIFPYYFRKSGLGKLVGKRSWGGVVGISGRGPLTDGGGVSVPLTATNNENGEYVIEGHGVDPDIEVWQEPKAMLEGRDQQLERGIEELLKSLEESPRNVPTRPADPMKDKANVEDYSK